VLQDPEHGKTLEDAGIAVHAGTDEGDLKHHRE
jgi:hypothetical protein